MESLEHLVEKNGVGSLVMMLAGIAERQGYDKEYVNALFATEDVYERVYG